MIYFSFLLLRMYTLCFHLDVCYHDIIVLFCILFDIVFFSQQKTEKTEFLTFFYKHCMHVLTAPLLANTIDDKPSKGKLHLSGVFLGGVSQNCHKHKFIYMIHPTETSVKYATYISRGY